MSTNDDDVDVQKLCRINSASSLLHLSQSDEALLHNWQKKRINGDVVPRGVFSNANSSERGAVSLDMGLFLMGAIHHGANRYILYRFL